MADSAPETSDPTAPLRAVFADNGWQFREVPDRAVLEADFEAHQSKVSLHVQVFPELGAVSVVSRCGTPAVPTRRGIAAELLMRANLELTLGGFEMDPDSGASFFRAGNLFPGGRIDPDILTGLVQAAVVEADRMTAMLGILTAVPDAELPGFSLPALLRREDLFPPDPSPPTIFMNKPC